MKKQEMNERDKARLHWLFLLQSDDYREFCELKATGKPMPEKFMPLSGPVHLLHPFFWTFDKFGDIHHKRFDDWFTTYHEDYPPLTGSVDDLSCKDPAMRNFMRNTFIFIIDMCKRDHGREPASMLEMADLLCATMRGERDFQSYLKIKQIEFTNKEATRLAAEVKAVLMAKIPVYRLRMDEMDRYLQVYVIRKTHGKGWLRIVTEQVKEYKNHKGVDVPKREIMRDLANAKKYIRQAENSTFLS